MNTIKKAPIKDKNIVLRVDYNVTLNPQGEIIDDVKIASTLPTIKYLLAHGAKKITLITHFGRPIVQPNAPIENIIAGNKNLQTKIIAETLARLLKIDPKKITVENNKNIKLPSYQIDDKIYLLENVRFDPREETNDHEFSRELASLGDIYIDDAFGNVHRVHASMVGIAKLLPSFAGLLMEKEVTTLGKLLAKPEKPFVLILGGAKTSEKIQTLKKLMPKSNKILLGGVMANTFLAGRNVDMKRSTYDKDMIEFANTLYEKAPSKFFLPNDLVWNRDIACDIGKTTIEQYKKIIATAKTIFWNGTMGLTSIGNSKYSVGTREIIQAIVESPAKVKIICGGDTIAEVEKMRLSKKMSFISTGGGAALEFLAGKKLEAIEALNRKN